MHGRIVTRGPQLGAISGSRHRQVFLQDLVGMFLDEAAWQTAVARENALVYEVYLVEPSVPEASRLGYGTTVLYPVMVGQEYAFTRGHRHQRMDRTEVYQVLEGKGCLLLADAGGNWESVLLEPGTVAYIGPEQAHRVINTGSEPLVWFAVYPSDAGHDYDWAGHRGFGHRLLKAANGEPQWVDG